MAAMQMGSALGGPKRRPPGLAAESEPEGQTVGRERRRVALAARVAVQEFNADNDTRLTKIENSVDRIERKLGCIALVLDHMRGMVDFSSQEQPVEPEPEKFEVQDEPELVALSEVNVREHAKMHVDAMSQVEQVVKSLEEEVQTMLPKVHDAEVLASASRQEDTALEDTATQAARSCSTTTTTTTATLSTAAKSKKEGKARGQVHKRVRELENGVRDDSEREQEVTSTGGGVPSKTPLGEMQAMDDVGATESDELQGAKSGIAAASGVGGGCKHDTIISHVAGKHKERVCMICGWCTPQHGSLWICGEMECNYEVCRYCASGWREWQSGDTARRRAGGAHPG